MSYIQLPDPHPGRCGHTQTKWDGTATIARRCLENEGTMHVCTFDPWPTPRITASSSSSYHQVAPKPWERRDPVAAREGGL